MKFKDYIPIGKENKLTHKEIMEKANIRKDDKFRRELAELRKTELIICDNGYYIPNKIEEVQEFLEKCNAKNNEVNTLIEMANKKINELEELEK